MDRYADTLLTDLRAYRDRLTVADRKLAPGIAVLDRTIAFLEMRLTAAAIFGCHHCDDTPQTGAPGVAPCWWCGLRSCPSAGLRDTDHQPHPHTRGGA